MIVNFKTYSTEIYFDKEVDPPYEVTIVLNETQYYRVRVLALNFYGAQFPEFLIECKDKDLIEFFEGRKAWVRHEIISSFTPEGFKEFMDREIFAHFKGLYRELLSMKGVNQ